ncbi:esterase/lipase family protein [Nocardia asteroides]|uniref:esterase/lipase family protein n=1 Tax=Nocardia asteroides TaxID=1824 RepID=UPI001E28E3FE|nr:alpha/beta hydrolase [Nocardia asteroides]UGT56058.1 GPI inositol-deacylase [Nocardia asteroides]
MTEQIPQSQAEVQALTRLAGEEFLGAVDGIAAIHRAISDRVFAAVRIGVGPAAAPVKAVHDAITAGVYAAVGGTGFVVSEVAGAVQLPQLPAPSRTVWGAGALAALQGLIGDELEDEAPILASPMTFRVEGAPVPPEQLAAHFAVPTSRLVVHVHGLVETEHAWRLGGRPAYGERLDLDLGYTPIFVRYNTGLHISENAALLSALLARLVAAWPLPVHQICLLGHSMGGLVARGACHQADEAGEAWVRAVRQVVCLGSPHLGAPLEQAAHYAAAAFDRLPETRPLATLLRRRSAGIRDLRQGSLVDDDWRDLDVDTLRARAIREVPLLADTEHYFVTATVTRSARHPLGRIIGDGLVLTGSGSGRGRTRRIGMGGVDGLHVPAAHHFSLLNHEAVYRALHGWLTSTPRRAVGVDTLSP